MAYRLERDESVVAGLKRVVREEISSATEHLAGARKVSRDEAIHETRKSIKKTRALLRLMRRELGDTYAKENARLRDIAGRLSEFRDAFAIIATFDDLKKHYRKETVNKLQTVRAGLAKKKSCAGKPEDVAIVLDEAASALRKAATRVKTWPLQTDGYQAIGPGLEEIYRAGRKALAVVRKNPHADHFHQLRKRVKDHWYHVRLV
jgi:CHAD domain-containing protein